MCWLRIESNRWQVQKLQVYKKPICWAVRALLTVSFRCGKTQYKLIKRGRLNDVMQMRYTVRNMFCLSFVHMCLWAKYKHTSTLSHKDIHIGRPPTTYNTRPIYICIVNLSTQGSSSIRSQAPDASYLIIVHCTWSLHQEKNTGQCIWYFFVRKKLAYVRQLYHSQQSGIAGFKNNSVP